MGSRREGTGCSQWCCPWMISRGRSNGARGTSGSLSHGACVMLGTQCSASKPGILPPRFILWRVTRVSYSVFSQYQQFLQFLSTLTLWHILSVNLFSLKSARSNLLVFKEESAWCILHSALWVCKSGFLLLSVLIYQPHVNAKCQVLLLLIADAF